MKLKDQQLWRDGTYNTKPRGQTDRLNQLKSSFYCMDGPTKSKQTIPNLHSLLTYGLSDMENYNFEFMELNRSLHVHYQEGKNSKGEGAGRGCMPTIWWMPKNKWSCCNDYQLKIKTVLKWLTFISLNDNWIKNQNWNFINDAWSRKSKSKSNFLKDN